MSSIREVRLPALSATMEEATLLSWKVAPGDAVSQGAPLAEVATDKVDMDLDSPFDGTIHELLVEPGAVVALGDAVATIETEAEDLLGGLDLAPETPATGTASEPEEKPTPMAEPEASPAQTTGIIPAAPPARKLARELGVDLAAIAPTGRRGQVTTSDVRRHTEAATPRPETTTPPVTTTPPPVTMDDPKRLSVRRATTQVMGRSNDVPQFTLWRTLVLDTAATVRGGVSWTTVLARGLVAALARHPEVNARWDDATESLVPFDGMAVGLAVDRPGVGLVVVTVDLPEDAETADQAIRSAADRARTGKLTPPDLAQASITLSNLGGLGVDRFNALLFPPQPLILSAGSIRMRPIATGDGALKAALTCEVGLTVDHRVADGADAARFLATFADLVETGR
jgi:pyruvate dehydrogenase E2 component (dihydrolipoamide acetyltransferase)